MFDDHLVREQVILDYKNMILHSRMVDSLKAIFGQKIANFLFVSLGQNGP